MTLNSFEAMKMSCMSVLPCKIRYELLDGSDAPVLLTQTIRGS